MKYSDHVLVTGSEGHIGRTLCAALDEKFEHVWGTDLRPDVRDTYGVTDVRSGLELAERFRVAEPETVYHLGGVVGRVVSEGIPETALVVNVVGTRNVAELCSIYGARLIHVSSSEVYGPALGRMQETDRLCPNNWYGLTKKLGEEVVQYYRKYHGLDATIVRPFMMYGETEAQQENRSAMIRFAKAIWEERQIEIHRGAERGWLHYDDAVRFLVELGTGEWTNDENGEDPPSILNIGNPDIRAIEAVPALMEKQMKKLALMKVVDLPAKMTAVKRPSLHRQMSMGLRCKVSLEEGVERVCKAVMNGS